MKDFIFDLQRFTFSGGSGTEADPYKISKPTDLQTLATDVNNGTSYSGKYFKVTANIDLQNVTYTAIGSFSTDSSDNRPFNGTFDGGGYTINNLTINSTSNNHQGLFGYVGGSGTVSNVTLTNVNISGDNYVGGVAGRNGGTVSNCVVSGTVTATEEVGGVVGRVGGTVSNCVATSVNVSGTSKVGVVVGSITTSGTLGTNYYYGTLADGVNNKGATQVYKLTADLPEGVTSTALVEINGMKYIKAGEVIFTYNSKDYKCTVNADITVTINNSKLYINGTEITSGPDLEQDDDGSYKIGSASNLQTLSAYVSEGNTCEGLTFKVTADIDMSGETFTAIGASFAGTFDGNNKAILNLGSTSLFAGTPTVTNLYYYNSPSITGGTQLYTLTLSDGVTASDATTVIDSVSYYSGTVTISGFAGTTDSIQVLSASNATVTPAAVSGTNNFTAGSLTLTGFSTANANEWTLSSSNAVYYTNRIYGASVSSNSIIYTVTTEGIAQVKLSGVNVNDNLAAPTSDGVLNLTANNFSGDVTVVDNTGGYKFNLASGTYNHSFTGTDDADTISNAGASVTLIGGAGNDSISNSGATVSINAGDGANIISNDANASNVTIISGAGADSISNAAQNVSISAGAGNDSITNTGDNVTIDGGGGKDIIIWSGNAGLIQSFDTNSTLQLATGNDTFATQASGNDLILTFDGGAVTLIGAAKNAEDLIDGNIIGSTPVNNEYKLAFNNKAEQEETAEEIAKKAQKATSATLQSDFEGILDANNYRKLKTIQTAKNFTSDVEIIGNTKANVISSGAGDDTINGGRKADTLTGGKGADTFIYADGDGRDVIKDYSPEDTLQISGTVRKASVSGKKVVLKVGTGSITLEKAVGQKVTTIDDNGEVTNIYRTEGKYDEDETSLKIFSTFSDTFKASAYKNLETIDGGAVKFEAIEIVGNDRDNSITGGSKTDNLSGGKGSDSIFGGKGADCISGGDGNDSLNGGTGFDTLIGGAGDDSLTGGAGQNLFVYESGDDVITDFSAGTANKIQLLNDSVTTDYTIAGEDLTLNFGNGSLTIKDYDGGEVRFLDANGNKSSYVFTADALLNANRTSATLATNNFTAYDKLVTIDARKISGSVNIEGNERLNKIYANDDGGTYTGGTGNDKFWGGKGDDTFIYADGDGRDIIYGFDNNDALEVNGIDEITAIYNAEKNYVRFKCGKGSIKLQDFTATEFAVNSDVWTLSGNTITKQ